MSNKFSKSLFENKEIVYIDLDNTVFNYSEQHKEFSKRFPDVSYPQSIESFFETLIPYDDAIEVIKELFNDDNYFVLFLTAPSIMNPLSYTEKRLSIERYFGIENCHRLIISSYKGLNKGDYLIDDYIEGKGQEYFDGELLHFGKDFKSWKEIRDYFKKNKKEPN